MEVVWIKFFFVVFRRFLVFVILIRVFFEKRGEG